MTIIKTLNRSKGSGEAQGKSTKGKISLTNKDKRNVKQNKREGRARINKGVPRHNPTTMIKVHRPTMKDMTVGQVLLGAIHCIKKTHIDVSLPGRLNGICSKKIRDSVKHISTGQILSFRIEGFTRFRNGLISSISVSPVPARVNMNIDKHSICVGSVLQVSVEHLKTEFYELNCGVKGVLCLMSTSESQAYIDINGGKDLVPGQIVWAIVLEVRSIGENVALQLSIDPTKVAESSTNISNLTQLRPGMSVDVTVKQVFSNGLAVTLNGSGTYGVIEESYLNVWSKPDDYEIGSVLKAMAIWILPGTQPFVYLSLKANCTTINVKQIASGTIFTEAPVYKMDQRNQAVVSLEYGVVCKKLLRGILETKGTSQKSYSCRVCAYDHLEDTYICKRQVCTHDFEEAEVIEEGQEIEFSVTTAAPNKIVGWYKLVKVLVNETELPKNYEKHSKALVVGKILRGKVLSKSGKREVTVSLKETPEKFFKPLNNYVVGQVVTATVQKIGTSFKARLSDCLCPVILPPQFEFDEKSEIKANVLAVELNGVPIVGVGKFIFPTKPVTVTAENLNDHTVYGTADKTRVAVTVRCLSDYPENREAILASLTSGAVLKDAIWYGIRDGLSRFSLRSSHKRLYKENSGNLSLDNLVGKIIPGEVLRTNNGGLSIEFPIKVPHSIKCYSEKMDKKDLPFLKKSQSLYGQTCYVRVTGLKPDGDFGIELSTDNLRVDAMWSANRLLDYLEEYYGIPTLKIGESVSGVVSNTESTAIEVELPNGESGVILKGAETTSLSLQSEIKAVVIHRDLVYGRLCLHYGTPTVNLHPKGNPSLQPGVKVTVLIIATTTEYVAGVIKDGNMVGRIVYVPLQLRPNCRLPTTQLLDSVQRKEETVEILIVSRSFIIGILTSQKECEFDENGLTKDKGEQNWMVVKNPCKGPKAFVKPGGNTKNVNSSIASSRSSQGTRPIKRQGSEPQKGKQKKIKK